jgi:GDP-D-mannose 3', 5'-epimerase
MSEPVTVVAGAGGFIGGHLVAALRREGRLVRAVDLKPLGDWYQVSTDVENVVDDLKLRDSCRRACAGAESVYQLGADMGGMGFIELNKARCMLSVLVKTHMLQASLEAGVKRFF